MAELGCGFIPSIRSFACARMRMRGFVIHCEIKLLFGLELEGVDVGLT